MSALCAENHKVTSNPQPPQRSNTMLNVKEEHPMLPVGGSLTSIGYDGKPWILVHDDAQLTPMIPNELVRSTPSESWLLEAGQAPHKPSSTGRIYVKDPTSPRWTGRYYPSVVNAKWVQLSTYHAVLRPEDMAPTLVELQDILERTRTIIAQQGRIVDDRLLEKERNLERVIADWYKEE